MILDSVTLFAEFWWIQIVYNRFPALHVDKKKQREERALLDDMDPESSDSEGDLSTSLWTNWGAFAAMPIFYGK